MNYSFNCPAAPALLVATVKLVVAGVGIREVLDELALAGVEPLDGHLVRARLLEDLELLDFLPRANVIPPNEAVHMYILLGINPRFKSQHLFGSIARTARTSARGREQSQTVHVSACCW